MATEVLVPPLGQTVDTVTLVEWFREEGEEVEQGDPLFAIETDKATLDVEAPASGVLRGVTARAGDEVKVLTAVALIAAPGEETAKATPPPPTPKSRPPEPEPAKAPVERLETGETRGRVFISPRARRLAEEHGVALSLLKPTGPEGAIVERDVRAYIEAYIEAYAGVSSAPGEDVLETVPLGGVRAVIAERMLRSVTTSAQVTLTAEADATELVELRRRLAQDGVSVSYSDLFILILGRALQEHPRLNASLDGDVIRVWRGVHIGLAVDTERGLLVPVVRDVAGKGLLQIAAETAALAERARAGKCPPGELTGGTFTLTNLGMFGIDAFTPIINLPECAVLGVGRIRRQPVMVGDGVVGRDMVWLSLTFDHRLVDGGPAARFLQGVVRLVEHPHLLIT